MITTPAINLNRVDPQPSSLVTPAWNVLEGVKFPASLRQLIVHAREHGASNDTLAHIAGIPDRVYTSPREVATALGTDGNVKGKSALWSAAGSEELAGEGNS